MTDQLEFDTDGTTRRVPSKLTETREAWQDKPVQLDLDTARRDKERLTDWTDDGPIQGDDGPC